MGSSFFSSLRLAVVFFFGGFSVLAQADQDSSVEGLNVESAWVRLLPPTVKTTAGYMTIKSDSQDKLISVTSPLAARVELHKSEMNDGVMSMNEVDGIALGAGETVELSPGGYHLMIMGLKKPLSNGQAFPLELEFESKRTLNLTATVKGS